MALVPNILEPALNEALFALITITPADGEDTLRIVNNNEQIVSRGKTYLPYAFTLTLPADTGEGSPTLTMTIDNVDRVLTEIVRELLDPPEVKLELVFSDTPDVVEKTIDFLRLVSAEYDAQSINFTLESFNILMLPAIDQIYDGDQWPDLIYT